MVFTVTGVLLGMYAALRTGYLRLGIFHVAAAVLLWFYSTHFKRQLLTGNLAVALLTAAVTFMPFIYEIGRMERAAPGFIVEYRSAVLSAFKYAWLFSIFAFITTLAREIIKDLEDQEGDRATGCHTMPIAWGDRSARLTAFFLLLITVILLLFLLYNTVRYGNGMVNSSTIFISALLVIPLALLSVYVLRATRTPQYTHASLALKGVMLAGLLYSLVFYYS
jgi:4-hydroxybenzoate polyprenyltransferase